MDIKTFKKALPYLMKAKVASLVWGRHGIGKSETAKQFADELGYKFMYLNLGTQDVGDLLGLPDFDTDDKGRKIATKHFTPNWLKEIIDYCTNNPKSGAILALDEMNRARRDVLQAVFPLVLEGRMHTTYLPNNCYIMAMSNPNTEDYIVTDIADKAFMDRFCHIKLDPTVSEWLDYAEKSDTDPDIIEFIRTQPELLENKTEDFNYEEVKPSRRSYKALDRLKKQDMPFNLLQELSYGLIGMAATTAFIESIKNTDKPLSAEDILKHFNKHKKRVEQYSDHATGGRMDLLKATSDNILKYVKSKDKTKFTAVEGDNLMKFLKAIPADLCYSSARELYLQDNLRTFFENDKEFEALLTKAKAKMNAK